MTEQQYNKTQAQAFERLALEATAHLRSSRELAHEFLSMTRGNQTEATRLNLRYVKRLFPDFIPRKIKGTPAERLYSRLQKAIETQAKTWTPAE